MSRRLLCLVPPTGRYVREDRCQAPVDRLKTLALRPPIDLLYAAACFERAGWGVHMRDLPAEGLGWDALAHELRATRFDCLLISATTPTLAGDLAAAALAREIQPELRIAAKGAHFATLDVATLERAPALDLVLRGEIEETCLELAADKPLYDVAGITWRGADGAIHRNREREFARELDALPFPARHLARNELYRRPDTGAVQTTVVTNRGCPHRCSYCLAQRTAGARNRHRSVESVVAELVHCVEQHGIGSFLLRSELFTQDRRWVLALCAAIRDARLRIEWACNARVDTVDAELLAAMRAAGCWIIAFGVESGDADALRRLRKRATPEQALRAIALCRDAGIVSSAYLLMGLPWDTRASVAALSRFARALDPDVLEVFFATPFPGTELHRQCVDQGLLAPDTIPTEAYDAPSFAIPGMRRDELVAARRRLLRRFYLRPRPILRTLARARSPRAVANVLALGAAQLRELARSS